MTVHLFLVCPGTGLCRGPGLHCWQELGLDQEELWCGMSGEGQPPEVLLHQGLWPQGESSSRWASGSRCQCHIQRLKRTKMYMTFGGCLKPNRRYAFYLEHGIILACSVNSMLALLAYECYPWWTPSIGMLTQWRCEFHAVPVVLDRTTLMSEISSCCLFYLSECSLN